jgi:hypothetical protein
VGLACVAADDNVADTDADACTKDNDPKPCGFSGLSVICTCGLPGVEDGGVVDGGGDDGACGSTDGLVVHLTFEEGAGTSTADLSGLGNGGALNGPQWTSGASGGGLSFTADDDVDLGSDSSLDNIPTLTVCTWIEPDIPSGYANLAVKAPSPYYGGWLLYLFNGGGPLGVGFINNSNQYNEAYNVVGPGWHHVCVTWDSAAMFGATRIYVDGLQETIDDSDSFGAGPQDDADQSLVLGKNTVDSGGYVGRMDEVRVYNRVLSPAEISDLAACITPPMN